MIWHQQVKQFKRRSPCAQWSFVGARSSFFLLFLLSIRMWVFFPPCVAASVNSCASRRLQDHPPPFLTTTMWRGGEKESAKEGEEKKSYAETEEWSYLHPQIPLLLDCAMRKSLQNPQVCAWCCMLFTISSTKHQNTMSNCVKCVFSVSTQSTDIQNCFEVVEFKSKVIKSENYFTSIFVVDI